jgi:3',5'-cyclic AMP phosphodiesterase CpdA
VKVALLSDTHVAARAPAFNANLQAAIAWIRTEQPDFVAHLGDITADGMYDPAEFRLADELLRTVDRPLYLLPGNHDVGDNPRAPAQENPHPVQPGRLDEYRRVLGPDWWSIQREGWQIVGLNALLFGSGLADEAEQFAWLEAQLGRFDGPLGVLLHKPLFRNSATDIDDHDRYVPRQQRAHLLELLGRRSLRFVISGHVHQARRLEVDSVAHIWMPATSFCIPDAVQAPLGDKIVGAGLLQLVGSEFHFEFVTPAGLVRHNLLDHAAVYPAVDGLRARISNGATGL